MSARASSRPGPIHLRGRVLPEGEQRDVYVVDGRITFESVRGARTLAANGWILPGLVDAHAHLALASPLARGSTAQKVRASARAQLDAGVLLVREPGGPDRSSAAMGVAEGLPRVVSAGRFLAPPGGYIPGLAREVEADALPRAAVEEARASGGKWAKVIGDFVGQDGRVSPHWEPETLRRAADAVHAMGARITTHAMHPRSIAGAIEAGFDAIEHGTGLGRDMVEAMAERKVALCPTLLIADAIPSFFEPVTRPEMYSEILGWLKTHPRVVAEAVAAGVTVLAGTDAGMGPHGMIGRKVRLLLDAGVPPARALGAASWEARSYLGLPGIEEHAPADVLVFDADPRGDHGALRRPLITVLDGRVVARGATAGPR